MNQDEYKAYAYNLGSEKSLLRSDGIIHHSDRGSQYASREYRKLLENNAMIHFMSRKANCWDNAPVESFFDNLKAELVSGQQYTSRKARLILLNRRLLQSHSLTISSKLHNARAG